MSDQQTQSPRAQADCAAMTFYRELRRHLGFGELWMQADGLYLIFRWFPDRRHTVEVYAEAHRLAAGYPPALERMAEREATRARHQYHRELSAERNRR